MHKLGNGQSVMFFAPQDIDRKIWEVVSNPSDKVEVSDILQWSMLERTRTLSFTFPSGHKRGISMKSAVGHGNRFRTSRNPSMIH